MPNIRELGPPLRPVKGCTVRFFVDEDAKDSKAPGTRWTETTYDGEPHSDGFEVPPHWHKFHDEYWTVLEGQFDIVINGKKTSLRAGDDTVHIPRRSVHGLKAIKGVKATLKETTDPSGAFKEAALRDFFQTGQQPGFWLAVRATYEGDSYVAIAPIQIIDEMIMTGLGAIAQVFAPPKPSDVPTVAT